MKGLTQQEFARRSNCSQATVSTALRAGRLALLPDGGIDPHFLKKQWRMNPKLGKRDADAPTPAKKMGRPMAKPVNPKAARLNSESASRLIAATLEKEQSLAALRRLEFEQRANRLIEIEVARRVLFEATRQVRDAWLNWPARVSPHLSASLGVDIDTLTRELTTAVRQHLTELGSPDELDFGRHEP